MSDSANRHTSGAPSPARTITVVLADALVALFPGAHTRMEIEAANVAELLDALDARWPGMRDRLRDSTPAIRKHVNIFVDGRRASLATPIRPGTTVFVLQAISGG
ncbi:MAG: MoaD/ThiS family protein [Pseudomonadota bacterium]|nr:MoaD/ThiS family protein [Pseudomonadota bacterium]